MTNVLFSTKDPWTQVYNALWKALEDDSDFAGMVQVGNRIKFTGSSQDPTKSARSTADFPEVMIQPKTAQERFALNSKAAGSSQVWEIYVATGRLQLDANDSVAAAPVGIFPLRWAIFCALFAAGDNLGLSFVTRTRITSSMSLENEGKDSGSPAGWMIHFTVVTDIELPKDSNGLLDNEET